MKNKTCPRCFGKLDSEMAKNAISRRDGKTAICHRCGIEEALIDAGFTQNSFAVKVDNIFTKTLKGESKK